VNGCEHLLLIFLDEEYVRLFQLTLHFLHDRLLRPYLDRGLLHEGEPIVHHHIGFRFRLRLGLRLRFGLGLRLGLRFRFRLRFGLRLRLRFGLGLRLGL